MESIIGNYLNKLGRIIKLKHAHNSTIYNNPLIYIILLERLKKFFRMADLLQAQI